MHAFWFALVIPGLTIAGQLINLLRNGWFWGLGLLAATVYLAIFSVPDFQAALSGNGISNDVFARILYRLILASNLPLVQVWLAFAMNLAIFKLAGRQSSKALAPTQ